MLGLVRHDYKYRETSTFDRRLQIIRYIHGKRKVWRRIYPWPRSTKSKRGLIIPMDILKHDDNPDEEIKHLQSFLGEVFVDMRKIYKAYASMGAGGGSTISIGEF